MTDSERKLIVEWMRWDMETKWLRLYLLTASIGSQKLRTQLADQLIEKEAIGNFLRRLGG